MNDLRICTVNSLIFNEFTVQKGMVYGLLPINQNQKVTIVSNCNLYTHKNVDGFWVYVQSSRFIDDYKRVWVTDQTHPKLFSKLQKALRKKARMGLVGVEYSNSNQLEKDRWEEDENSSHFQSACNFVGKTPKSNIGALPYQVARQSNIERNTLTQRVNYVLYKNCKNPYII